MARQTVPGLLHAAATPASSPGFVTPVFTAIACVVPPKRCSSALQQFEGSIYLLSIKYLWCTGALIKNQPPKELLCAAPSTALMPQGSQAVEEPLELPLISWGCLKLKSGHHRTPTQLPLHTKHFLFPQALWWKGTFNLRPWSQLSSLLKELSSGRSFPNTPPPKGPGLGGCPQPSTNPYACQELPWAPPPPSLWAAMQDGAKESGVPAPASSTRASMLADLQAAPSQRTGIPVLASTAQGGEMYLPPSWRLSAALSIKLGKKKRGAGSSLGWHTLVQDESAAPQVQRVAGGIWAIGWPATRLPAFQRGQAQVHLLRDKELVHFRLKTCIMRTAAIKRIFAEEMSAEEQLPVQLKHGQKWPSAKWKLGKSHWESNRKKPVVGEKPAAAGRTHGKDSRGFPVPWERDGPLYPMTFASFVGKEKASDLQNQPQKALSATGPMLWDCR